MSAEDNYFAKKYGGPNASTDPALGGTTPTTPQFPSDDKQANNYFAQKYGNVGQQPPPVAASQRPPSQGDAGAFMAGVESFNRVFGRIAEGALDLGARAGEAMGVPGASQFRQGLANENKLLNASLDQAATQHPLAAAAGTTAGIIGTSAIPFGTVPKGAGMGMTMLTSAGSSALMSAVSYNPTFEGRMDNAVVGGVLGGIIPPVFKGYGMASGDIGRRILGAAGPTVSQPSGFLGKVLHPERSALHDAALEVKNAGSFDSTMANANAFKQADIPVSMADAAQNPGINSTLLGKKMDIGVRGDIQNLRVPQTEAIAAKASDALESFVPGGRKLNAEIRNNLYDNLKNIQVSDDVQKQLLDNPSIAQRMELLNKNTDLGMGAIPNSNLAKWDALNKHIAGELWTNANKLGDDSTKMLPQERVALQGVKGQMADVLDAAHPDYKPAREAGERVHFYDLFQDQLAKPTYKAGTGNELTNDQFYSKLWGTPEKQEFFLDAVKNTGGNVDNVQNLMKVMNLTKSSVLDKMIATPNGKSAETYSTRSALNIAEKFANALSHERYEDALLKLTLSPTWQDKLSEALQKPSLGPKMQSVLDLLSSITKINSGQAIGGEPISMAIKSAIKPVLASYIPSIGTIGARVGGFLGASPEMVPDDQVRGLLNPQAVPTDAE